MTFDRRDPGTDPDYCDGLAPEDEDVIDLRGFCPTCRSYFLPYDVTLEPYCSPRCRIEGESL